MKAAPWVLAVLAACKSHAPQFQPVDREVVARWTGGLPISGDLRSKVDLSVDPAQPVEDWSKVTGRVELACEHCVIGDDRTKLSMGGLVGDLELGHIDLGKIAANATFADGKVHIVGSVSSPESEVHVRVDGKLAKRAEDTQIDGCVRFRPLDPLRQRDPKAFDVMLITGAERRADGLFAIKLAGKLGEMVRLNRDCKTDYVMVHFFRVDLLPSAAVGVEGLYHIDLTRSDVQLE
jgi:hypothetical protein